MGTPDLTWFSKEAVSKLLLALFYFYILLAFVAYANTTLAIRMAGMYTVNSKEVVTDATRDSPDRKKLSQREEKSHVLILKFKTNYVRDPEMLFSRIPCLLVHCENNILLLQ